MSVRVFAPAKINLSLQVGAARGDGYHPLESLVVFADAGDWVEASEADELTLDVQGPFAAALATEADNLVLRAARALAKEAGVAPRARLVLQKELPVASGIGGGSSDAAATLKALVKLWRLDFTEERLLGVASGVGADVPVCMAARSAWMSGLGERLSRWRAPPLPAVLVNPMKPLATRAVFGEFDRAASNRRLTGIQPSEARDAEEVISLARSLGNDLAAPARRLLADIVEIETALGADPRVRFANLSGSGATMFALCDAIEAARDIEADITRMHPHWWTRATTLAAT